MKRNANNASVTTSCPQQSSKRPRDSTAPRVSPFTEEILLHIFSFFGCRGRVDGTTLNRVSQTCKRWYSLSQSQTLWKMNTPDYRSSHFDIARHPSLNIKTTSTENCQLLQHIENRISGFAKLRRLLDLESNETATFLARDRATGNDCYLVLCKSQNAIPSADVIGLLYEAHASSVSAIPSSKCRQPCFLPTPKAGIHHVLTGATTTDTELNESVMVMCFAIEPLPVSTDVNPVQTKYLDEPEQSESSVAPLQARCRVEIVDYVMEVVECFDLDAIVGFITIMLARRAFLGDKMYSLSQASQQRCIVTCLFIASRCTGTADFERLQPSDLAMASDHSFDASQLANYTLHMLHHRLDYRLAFPTILDFLRVFRQTMDAVDELEWHMWSFVGELALQCSIENDFENSKIAAACVALARLALKAKDTLWPAKLKQSTGVALTDEKLVQCILELSQQIHEVAADSPELSVVRRRYRKPVRSRVAEIVIPQISSDSQLLAYERRNNRL